MGSCLLASRALRFLSHFQPGRQAAIVSSLDLNQTVAVAVIVVTFFLFPFLPSFFFFFFFQGQKLTPRRVNRGEFLRQGPEVFECLECECLPARVKVVSYTYLVPPSTSVQRESTPRESALLGGVGGDPMHCALCAATGTRPFVRHFCVVCLRGLARYIV